MAETPEVLISADEIRDRIAELAAEISRDYAGRTEPLLLICVLKGAVVFLTDLMRALDVPVQIEFLIVSSYGAATKSSGVVQLIHDIDRPLADRDVLVVEDIVDTGRTLDYLLRVFGDRGPASLEVCALLSKPDRREVEVDVKYIGFPIPDRFVVGYGLDVDEAYRDVPFVGTLDGL